MPGNDLGTAGDVETYKGVSTADEINPHYLTPKQGLVRLQKIMDEYAAGTSAWYTTNGPMLQRGSS